MAWCPFATRKALPWQFPTITPTQFIVHSAVTPAGYNLYQQWLGDGPTGVNCHFYIRLDGSLEQFIDTAQRASAQYEGNAHGVSVETEGLDPDRLPWNSPQMATLIHLGKWVTATHAIPAVQCATPTSPGIGWHSMWPDRTWNHDAHSCPGAARIAQMPAVIAGIATTAAPPPTPALPVQQEDDDMNRRLVKKAGDARVYLAAATGGSAVHLPDNEKVITDVIYVISQGGGTIVDPPTNATTVTVYGHSVWEMASAVFDVLYPNPV